MQALEAAGVKQGQRVLIHAGAGGVGHFAVQLAKARGAHVITTAGPRNVDFVQQVASHGSVSFPVPSTGPCSIHRNNLQHPLTLKHARCCLPCLVKYMTGSPMEKGLLMQELGADEAIDYTSSRFEEVLKSHPVDAVIDPMAGAASHRLRHMLL